MELTSNMVIVCALVAFFAGFETVLAGGGGGSEHVHLKIHLPKIIKKHTHTQTVYKHHYHKKPQSNPKSRIDPKINLSAALKSPNYFGHSATGNELNHSWSPKYPSKDTGLSQGYSDYQSTFNKVNYYPKQEEEDGEKSQYMAYKIKHTPSNYQIEDEDEMEHQGEVNSGQTYSESQHYPSFVKHGGASSYQNQEIQFIPASQVADLIPTIPFSALTAQSRFQPIWTPPETEEIDHFKQQRLGYPLDAFKRMLRKRSGNSRKLNFKQY